MAKVLKNFLAVDVGGSGGRCSAGSFDGDKLSLESLAGIDFQKVTVLGQSYWNVLALFEEIVRFLAAYRRQGRQAVSLGIDTMGVNFALLDKNGSLLANPFYTRIPQRPEVIKAAFGRLPAQELYATTGLQLSKLNSLYHLVEMAEADSPLLEAAAFFLMLPDLLNYWLTGEMVGEYTIASTSHLLNASTRNWATDLAATVGLPAEAFAPLVRPGHCVGALTPELADRTGRPDMKVIATSSHDTAAALACLDEKAADQIFISCGTWGMVGCFTDQPITNAAAREANFSNEGAAQGNIRFLRNAVNLEILEQCRAVWGRAEKAVFRRDLIEAAAKAPPFSAFFDPLRPEFLREAPMPDTILEVCRARGQSLADNPAAIGRAIFESLAFRYRSEAEKIKALTGNKAQTVRLIGGGAHNRLLCQFVADALNAPVVAACYDVTVVGNIITQMIAAGDLADYRQGRELIQRCFESRCYVPENPSAWDDNYERYRQVMVAESLSDETETALKTAGAASGQGLASER